MYQMLQNYKSPFGAKQGYSTYYAPYQGVPYHEIRTNVYSTVYKELPKKLYTTNMERAIAAQKTAKYTYQYYTTQYQPEYYYKVLSMPKTPLYYNKAIIPAPIYTKYRYYRQPYQNPRHHTNGYTNGYSYHYYVNDVETEPYHGEKMDVEKTPSPFGRAQPYQYEYAQKDSKEPLNTSFIQYSSSGSDQSCSPRLKNMVESPIEKKKGSTYLMKRDAQGKFMPTHEGYKPKKKEEKIWKEAYRIVQVDYPVKLPETAKRKYVLDFYYLDENDKKHKKKIRFGRTGVDDYIEHHDLKRREKTLNSLRNPGNPFRSNFWIQQLLNSQDDLNKNYLSIIQYIHC